MANKNAGLKILGFLGLGWLAYRFLGATNFAYKVKFEVKAIGTKGLNAVVKIAVLNPTTQNFTLNNFVGGLIAQGREVAIIKNFTPTQLHANSATEIELIFVPSVLGIVELVKDIVTHTTGSYGLGIVGNANVSSVSIPVNLVF